MENNKISTANIVLGIITGSLIIIALFWGIPVYRVWQKTLAGKAHLREAEFNRQIQVVEAEAKAHAAKSLAEAEITRAGGVAKANAIIGESLKNNESYLRYLWIESLQHTQDKVIYVPTEAGLPILEAHRLDLGNR